MEADKVKQSAVVKREAIYEREPNFLNIIKQGVRISFVLGADEDAGSVENIDATIELPGGQRWGATLLTVCEIERLLARWERSGECANGLYLWVPDLIVINGPGIERMVAAIFDLIQFDLDDYGLSRLTPLKSGDDGG